MTNHDSARSFLTIPSSVVKPVVLFGESGQFDVLYSGEFGLVVNFVQRGVGQVHAVVHGLRPDD